MLKSGFLRGEGFELSLRKRVSGVLSRGGCTTARTDCAWPKNNTEDGEGWSEAHC